ncbi:MAG: hypothetical protein ABIG84_04660 [archaeon]
MTMNIISEENFYRKKELNEGMYIVQGDDALYLGVVKGEERVDTGISSDFLKEEDVAISALYGIQQMEKGLESYWTIQSEGKIEKRDASATIYTSPEFRCGGYANANKVIILKNTGKNQIHGLMIRPNEVSKDPLYISSESSEPKEIRSAKTIEEVLERIGLGALVNKPVKKRRSSEYIIA